MTRLLVSPDRPNLDTVLRIRVVDVPPGAQVRVSARSDDPRGRTWRAATTFVAAADGTVDLCRDAPVSGSYRGIDPMGLIWSMELDPESRPSADRVVDFLAPTPLTLVAEVAGERASAEVRRLRVPHGLVRTEVRTDGLVGTLYAPEGSGRLPGVIMLGGAEGGLHEDDAALLAAHGYAALALAYYGLPGLPDTLRDIPLEYFGAALRFLAAHPRVDPDRIAVTGGSKGGEAALLIGVTYPQVRAVVSVVGSGIVTQGISQDVLSGSFLDIMGTPVAGWTYHGRELPYLPNVITPALEALVAAGEPVPLRLAFEPGLAWTDRVATATIPVERIAGAVLLLSTEDDQGYGVAFHEAAAERLAAHRQSGEWKHIVYPGAGHSIAAPPYAPTTVSLSPGPGVTFRNGGTAEADANARAGAWTELRRFLADHL